MAALDIVVKLRAAVGRVEIHDALDERRLAADDGREQRADACVSGDRARFGKQRLAQPRRLPLARGIGGDILEALHAEGKTKAQAGVLLVERQPRGLAPHIAAVVRFRRCGIEIRLLDGLRIVFFRRYGHQREMRRKPLPPRRGIQPGLQPARGQCLFHQFMGGCDIGGEGGGVHPARQQAGRIRVPAAGGFFHARIGRRIQRAHRAQIVAAPPQRLAFARGELMR